MALWLVPSEIGQNLRLNQAINNVLVLNLSGDLYGLVLNCTDHVGDPLQTNASIIKQDDQESRP